jgi:multiple sugar transport system permease protein
MSFESREHAYGYVFVVPALLFMLAFVGYPIVYNLVLSLQDVNVMTFSQKTKEFVGLRNYQQLFQGEMIFITLENTAIYTVGSIAFQFVIGFALALFFTRQFPLSAPIRGLLVITWMMPMTVTALLYKFMLSPTNGIVDEILRTLHLIEKPVGWLIHINTALWGVILANIWVGVPFNMILLSTGLANIPEELYESASIDGANASQRFTHITLPLLRPAILSVVILGVIYTFKVFDLVFVMTGGGPVNATEVLSTYAYRQSFSEFNFSIGAAIANVLFLCLFVVGLGYIKTIRKEEVMT